MLKQEKAFKAIDSLDRDKIVNTIKSKGEYISLFLDRDKPKLVSCEEKDVTGYLSCHKHFFIAYYMEEIL